MSWQPIETAPRDGAHFIGWWDGYKRPFICWWHAKSQSFDSLFDTNEEPSHWMPLPPPPPGHERPQ